MYMDARVIVSYNIPAFEGWKNLLNCMLVKGRLGMLILPSDLFFVPFKFAFTTLLKVLNVLNFILLFT